MAAMPQVIVIDRNGDIHAVEIDTTREPKAGGEGFILFTPDDRHVIKIFHEEMRHRKNPEVISRIIQAGPLPTEPTYKLFGWPIGLVIDNPENQAFMGVIMRNVMEDGWLEEMIWYSTPRIFRNLERSKWGDFRGRVKAAIDIADAIRYVNFMGFAQADISGRNFLINPVEGRAVLIDLDGLAVPDYMDAAVLGTPGYMAPELVIGAQEGRPVMPNIRSDRHALAVLLYQLLLMHHPLVDGRRPALADDPQLDMFLRTGKDALYVAHPTDDRNRPPGPVPMPSMLGPELEGLFRAAFIEGLHNPDERPAHFQFKKALENLLDDLTTCNNAKCIYGAFPTLNLTVKRCPICNSAADFSDMISGYLTILQASSRQPGIFKRNKSDRQPLPRNGLITTETIFGGSGETGLLRLTPKGSGWTISRIQDDPKVLCYALKLRQNAEPQMIMTHQDHVVIDQETQIVIKHRDSGTRIVEVSPA